MRLIDADALLMNMNLAIAILEGTMKNLGLQDDAECQMELKAYRDIRDGIKDEPTAEPTVQPEIIRCKDCKHYLHDEEYGFDWCNRMSGVFRAKPDGFCSWAVMRGGDSE